MTTPIGASKPVGTTAAVATPDDPAARARAKKSHGLAEAGREFEAIFVRSMLKESGMAKKGDSYGDMAIDAVAKSITAGGGLGLGELIKRAIETNEKHAPDEKKTTLP